MTDNDSIIINNLLNIDTTIIKDSKYHNIFYCNVQNTKYPYISNCIVNNYQHLNNDIITI